MHAARFEAALAKVEEWHANHYKAQLSRVATGAGGKTRAAMVARAAAQLQA